MSTIIHGSPTPGAKPSTTGSTACGWPFSPTSPGHGRCCTWRYRLSNASTATARRSCRCATMSFWPTLITPRSSGLDSDTFGGLLSLDPSWCAARMCLLTRTSSAARGFRPTGVIPITGSSCRAHLWLSKKHPDPSGAKLQMLVRQLGLLGAHDDDAFAFIDITGLPQHDTSDPDFENQEEADNLQKPGEHRAVRTEAEEALFTKALGSMELIYSMINTPVIVLPMDGEVATGKGQGVPLARLVFL
ncbi:unnamed protein product [Prorocentrum cordatum]|uniref:Uncharacterized protein n=1 Tax=Prorocentrum cordatum TaxID=2364126 RepID=A0ABN9PUD9_9DINO|nr:unnamed protein product [Polarella glacialis]